MAVSVVSVGAATSGVLAGSSQNISPALASGFMAGDLIVYAVSVDFGGAGAGSTISTPAGYTRIITAQHTTGVDYPEVGVFVRAWQSGDAAPAFAIGAASGTVYIAQCINVRGADTSSPLGTTGTQFNGSSAQNIGPISGITPGAAGALVIAIARKSDDWTSVAQLSGWTEIGEPSTTAGGDGGMVWDYQVQTTAAATGNQTFTVTGGGSNFAVGIIFSIKAGVTTTPVDSGDLDFDASSDLTGAGTARMGTALALAAATDFTGSGVVLADSTALDFDAASDFTGYGVNADAIKDAGLLALAAASSLTGAGVVLASSGALAFAAASNLDYVIPGAEPRDAIGRLWATTGTGAGLRVTVDPTGCFWRDGFMKDPSGRWLIEIGGRGKLIDGLMRNPGTGAVIVTTSGPVLPVTGPYHDGEYRLVLAFN